jgi:hypothetical protein
MIREIVEHKRSLVRTVIGTQEERMCGGDFQYGDLFDVVASSVSTIVCLPSGKDLIKILPSSKGSESSGGMFQDHPAPPRIRGRVPIFKTRLKRSVCLSLVSYFIDLSISFLSLPGASAAEYASKESQSQEAHLLFD